MTPNIKKVIEDQEYLFLKENKAGICGLHRFIFTVGLCYGLGASGYKGRYCYDNFADAKEALEAWDGVGHPSGDWIKHKGQIEFPNFNKCRV